MILSLAFISTILAVALIITVRRIAALSLEKNQLLEAGAFAQDIADRLSTSKELGHLPEYILETSMKMVPFAKYGVIFTFDSEGMLSPDASHGFSEDELIRLRFPLEEAPIYIATAGKLDRAITIGNLREHAGLKGISRFCDPIFPVLSEIAAPLRAGGEIAGLLCLGSEKSNAFTERDVTMIGYMAYQLCVVLNHQKLNRDVQRLIRYDNLTLLLNRESFEQEAIQILSDPSKDSGNFQFVLMDLEEMRAANEKYGHHFGDKVIKGFSDIVRTHLNRNAICGRYGGDEFAAVIQGEKNNVAQLLDDAKVEFKKLKTNGTETTSFIPDFSYGLVSMKEGANSLPLLYTLADLKMKENRAKAKESDLNQMPDAI